MTNLIQKILKETLGENLVITPLSGGRSGASLWSVTRGEEHFVARQSGPHSQFDREQTCIRLAAERGLAPRVLYAFEGLIVMEHVVGSPIHRGTPRETDPLGRLAGTLRHLHAGPAFPEGPTILAMFRDLEKHIQGLPQLLGRTLEETTPAFLELSQPAPCHLDLNPSNILAGDDQICLVDWELASQNEPYLDLAQLGVWVCRDSAEREELLYKYLKGEASAIQKERMRLARLQTLSFYTSAFHLVTHMQGRRTLDQGPELDGVFQEMARSGRPFQPESMAHALLLELQRELEQIDPT